MHEPVLLQETIANLICDPHGIYVDCTLGGGGHLRYLIENLEPDARVIGIDKDLDILNQTRLCFNDPRLTFIQSDFRDLTQVLQELNVELVDGIMMDLGVSSFQLDEADRGFSFHEDAPLDMRMNREQFLTAREIVNGYGEAEIREILFKYGEETYARNIAKAIVSYRAEKDIESTLELVDIIKKAVPGKYCREKHPARKSFQALRIVVNGELEALQAVLPQAVKMLKPKGRLCVISFHSLEDRIVKQFMQEKSRNCICPPDFPMCICEHRAQLKLISRKPFIASSEESTSNPRSRSAKLRVAARI
ncbi:MAG: 16S rRNA (cytosine(1402)-N(4))-methyltransferase [Firmicutes bacterium HGW-Firmicutes-15]|nr:MAG: 16S rRNA (cytosine(1402)-N(4))-methyltransferase [Firmicutes bacterium HGW-Firmicutes-15]